MEIEDIAKLDLFLKSQNSFQNMYDIDNLIVIKNDQNSVLKLKDAAGRLQRLDINSAEEIKATWNNLLGKQVRYSVNRVKLKRNGD